MRLEMMVGHAFEHVLEYVLGHVHGPVIGYLVWRVLRIIVDNIIDYELLIYYHNYIITFGLESA